MARPRVSDKINVSLVAPVLTRRTAWPVAMLADVLGCDRETVYRRVRNGKLRIGSGGVEAESVIQWLQDAP